MTNMRYDDVPCATLVWFLSIVCFKMSPQTICPKGFIVTLVAFVWLFSYFLQCAFSNVSSRRCKFTLVAFVWLFSSVFSNVSSNHLPKRMHSQIGCIFYFYPLCVFKCVYKWSAWEDAHSHWLHLFDFPSVRF